MKPRNSPRTGTQGAGCVRIIGGRLRGSRLDVPQIEGLRPTSDRVRETLFNWLAPHLPGARCLDLFAGSGALGFEAASRGADEVLMLERDPHLARMLGETAERLRAGAVRIVAADAIGWLRDTPARRFDIVFVDPPFAAGLHQAAFAALAPWLASQAMVYVESQRDAVPAVPLDWLAHREGSTREVRYALYRSATAAPATLADDTATQANP